MSSGKGKKSVMGTIGGVVLLAVIILARQYLEKNSDDGNVPSGTIPPPADVRAAPPSDNPQHSGSDTSRDIDRVAQAFEDGRSDVKVEVEGRVDRVLADDNEGSRHQRFIVELRRGLTVLVAHNIDLAPRVPLGEGDTVRIKGEYEWNDRGGVLHWTHHDPRGRAGRAGWIELDGKRYE